MKVGSLEVEPIHVDHSVPGAYGFIIHTTEGAVIYSGDFRIHGTKSEMTRDFVKAAAENKPIAMLCEGTNLIGADFSTEHEVNEKINKVVGTTQNLVLASFRHTDVDRTRTLFEVAKRNQRKLAISLRQAYMLNKLKADKNLDLPAVDSKDFLIFKREKKSYFKWEKAILDFPNAVDAQEVKRMQSKVILATGFSDLKELVDMHPMQSDPFWRQKSTKSANRRRILTALTEAGQTFGELERKVELSRPVLSIYMKELEKAGEVARQIKGRRIEYVLTDKGKGQERMRRESIAKAFQVVGQLTRNYSSAKSMLEIAEFAKESPEFFAEFLQWMTDYMTLVLSDDTLRWLRRHRDGSGKLLQAEVMKKLAPFIKEIHADSEDDPKKVMSIFQNLLNSMKEVISETGGTRP